MMTEFIKRRQEVQRAHLKEMQIKNAIQSRTFVPFIALNAGYSTALIGRLNVSAEFWRPAEIDSK